MKLKSKCLKTGALFLVMMLACGTGYAAERVSMASPAKDAAFVPLLLGMVNNYKTKDLYGTPATVNDGIVIRQSYIENGKIVIPPGGLYVTSRSGNWDPFRAAPMTIAGKEYFVATDLYERDVVKNVSFEVGQIIPINPEKTRGFQLTGLDTDPYGMPGHGNATFKLVKATGNYYGDPFPVYAGPLITNVAESKLGQGTGEKAGTTIPTAKNKLSEMIYASNMFSVGRSHVIIEGVEGKTVKVKELATDSCTDLFVTSTAPTRQDVAAGESFKAGGAKVEVREVTKDGVKIRLTDAKGTVEKVLGPYSDKSMEWITMSMTAREPFWVLSSDGTVLINLDIRKEGAPVNAGKASLVVYTNVINIKNSSVWAADPRFLATPET